MTDYKFGYTWADYLKNVDNLSTREMMWNNFHNPNKIYLRSQEW